LKVIVASVLARRDGSGCKCNYGHCDKAPITPHHVKTDKNSSGDEIANVNFFYNIAHVEASAYAH